MRDILFKAKRLDNGEWIEGYYCQLPKMSLGATIIANGEACAEDTADYIVEIICKQHSSFSNAYPLAICEYELHEINPLTLCQYTGLKDKNEVKIFEGDIVKHYTDCVIDKYSIDTGKIFWYQRTQRYLMTSSIFPDDCKELSEVRKYEVIGNIHDKEE